ncbi:MAG: class II glutamine amidotransferase [Candidatus Eisenbacteria bacterium]|nr:class II glutamine amidotransferase [Candidatus Eisenbacteria bacterium]
MAASSMPASSMGEASDTLQPHNCRLWAIVGHDYPGTLISNQLRDGLPTNLKQLGTYNQDGWGLAYFPDLPEPSALRGPIIRRGGPRSSHPFETEYDIAVDEMDRMRPKAAIGHVRAGTSGHWGIPNPHPFLQRGMVFAHNGGANVTAMEQYLEEGKYLDSHPPDYVQGIGSSGHVDSELFFLCLLKHIDDHPGRPFAEALLASVRHFVSRFGGGALNFVLTDGDTLYALNCYGTSNSLRYFSVGSKAAGGGSPEGNGGAPAGGDASPYWVVASEPMGSGAAVWGTMALNTFGIFIPDRDPVFYPLADVQAMDNPAPDAPSPEAWRFGDMLSSLDAVTSRVPDSAPTGRFWALVGSGYSPGMIARHLQNGVEQNLEVLASTYDQGWGIGYSLADPPLVPLELPLIRRGGPAANDEYEPEYTFTVDEMEALAPRAAMAHVRADRSEHAGIPNPDPFLHEGMLFAHDGRLRVQTLQARIGLDFLGRHPTDYVQGVSGTSRVDGELYFLYLLKLIKERPELAFTDALLEAVRTVSQQVDLFVEDPELNFVLQRGDTLYALQYCESHENREHYHPAVSEKEPSPFWVVASESLGSGAEGWAPIPEETLAVFIPGQAPRFLPLQEPGPLFTLSDVRVTYEAAQDLDGDGRLTGFEVCADPNVDQGTAQVWIALFARTETGERIPFGATRIKEITASLPDTLCLQASAQSQFPAWPDTLAGARWDLEIELWQAGEEEPVTVATGQSHPGSGLAHLPVEGLDEDAVKTFALSHLQVETSADRDEDGYATALSVCADPDVAPGGARIELRLVAIDEEAGAFEIGRTASVRIAGEESDSLCVRAQSGDPQWPASLEPHAWDLRVEVWRAGEQAPAFVASGAEHPELRDLLVEGMEGDLPDTLTLSIGFPRPNPITGELFVPIETPPDITQVSAEILDGSGRLVWSGALPVADGGVRWSAFEEGVQLASGVYLLRISVDGKSETRRFALIRQSE